MTLTVKMNRIVRCATKVSAIVVLATIIMLVKQDLDQRNYLIEDVQGKKMKHFIVNIAIALKMKCVFMEDAQLEVSKLEQF